jgi:hypothetical protein
MEGNTSLAAACAPANKMSLVKMFSKAEKKAKKILKKEKKMRKKQGMSSLPTLARAKQQTMVNALVKAEKKIVKAQRPRKKNAFKQRNNMNQGAMFPSGKGRFNNVRSQLIVEDEFITDVVGSQDFATTAYPINPGQAGVFPWGSKIAALYEKYEFEYLEFYYKPIVNAFASQGGFGKVMLSAIYDALGTSPATKQQVEDSAPHSDCMPYESASLRLDRAQLRGLSGGKYVRPGAQPANSDLRVYDGGKFFFSTAQFSATGIGTAIGELRVRYKVRVSYPLLEAAAVAGGVVHYSTVAAVTANNFAGGSFVAGGSVNLSAITVGTNEIVFPENLPGNYLIVIQVQGGTSASAITAASDGDATALNLLSSGTLDATNAVGSLAGTTDKAAMLVWCVTVPVGGATLSIGASTISGPGSADIFIVSLPTSLVTFSSSKRINDTESKVERLEHMLGVLTRKLQLVIDEQRDDSVIISEEKGDSVVARVANVVITPSSLPSSAKADRRKTGLF